MNQIDPCLSPSCPTYRKILDTSKDILMNNGLAAFTVRRVATEAKVNVAAINYHFKSKENLLNILLAEISAPLYNELQTITQSHDSPKEKLKQLFLCHHAFISHIPPSIFHSLISRPSLLHNQICSQEIRSLLEYLQEIIQSLLPKKSKEHIFITAIQLLSSYLFSQVLSQNKPPFFEEKPLPPIEQQINILIENFFGS